MTYSLERTSSVSVYYLRLVVVHSSLPISRPLVLDTIAITCPVRCYQRVTLPRESTRRDGIISRKLPYTGP